MKRHPSLLFTYFPDVIMAFVKNKLGIIPNHLLQRKLFSYLTMIDDYEEQIERYWDKYESRISAWYLAQKRIRRLPCARKKRTS